MTTKQVLFRLKDSTLISFDSKLTDKGISKQFFFNKCVELFINDEVNFFDNNFTSNNKEVESIKKQLDLILARLNISDNDNSVITVIANDKTIVQSEVKDDLLATTEEIPTSNHCPEIELQAENIDEDTKSPKSKKESLKNGFTGEKITVKTRLTTKQLLQRLGKKPDSSCLTYWTKNRKIEQNTTKHDPEGIGWKEDRGMSRKGRENFYKPLPRTLPQKKKPHLNQLSLF